MVVTRNVKNLSYSELTDFLEKTQNLKMNGGEKYYSTNLNVVVTLRMKTTIEFPLKITLVPSNNLIRVRFQVGLTKVWILAFALSFTVFGLFYLVYANMFAIILGMISGLITYSILIANIRSGLEDYVNNIFRRR
jgi:hypothetical protein